MKKSHPDNNGNAEDFDKFRKLYEKIKQSIHILQQKVGDNLDVWERIQKTVQRNEL